MIERELKEDQEILVHDVGETEPEFTNTGKEKKIKRLIIILIILLIIAAIIVTLVLLLRKSDDDDEPDKPDDHKPDQKNFNILMEDSNFTKPKSLTKKFELIQLKGSNYSFVLVHDPKTVKAGVEIRTKFGFDTEPIDGFAHYAEHVFFRGTQKVTTLDIFNIIGRFNEFVNAYTWEEETVFQYFGSNYTFDTLLSYVSDFIQNPALNETQFLTEINAVNSEYDTYNYSYENALNILRDNANPEHGFYQTSTGHTGNNDSLREYNSTITKEIFRNYFRTIFKPENCFFLLYSSKSFDEMANLALKHFNFTLEKPTEEFTKNFTEKIEALDNPIFKEGQLGKFAIYNSVIRETPLLLINFLVSQPKDNYSLGEELFEYLTFDFKEGSLSRFLFKNNYISDLDYLTVGYYKNYEMFQLLFDLTEDGLNNVDTVIEAVFAFINTAKSDENIEELLKNIKEIKQKTFDFAEDRQTTFPGDIDNIMESSYLFGFKNMLGNPIDVLFTKERALQILNELSPDRAFILIDSSKDIDSHYLNSEEVLFTRNYKIAYKMNDIPRDILNHLKEVKSIEDYNFALREKNNDYSKLNDLTEKPCYEKSANECAKYKEFDPKNSSDLEPLIVKDKDNVLSLMKIDRSFGIPFVKGYINIELDPEQIKELMSLEVKQATCDLLLDYLNTKFSQSSLAEGGTTISINFKEPSNLIFIFSTYNDLLNKTIDYIINLFNETIDEATFKYIKEHYLLSYAQNINSPAVDFRNEIFNVFKRFISVDTFEFYDYSKETIEQIKFSDMDDLFMNMVKINRKSLKYLTYGDISYELASSTTVNLSSLITNKDEVTLLLKEPKIVEIPDNSSILYILKSKNIYQRQGRTLVLYEFNETLKEKMEIYSYFAADILFDYIRSQKGSGYAVKTRIENVLNKYYLFIYVLGKVYSPAEMDRLVNEGIKLTFSYKGTEIDLIRQHLKNRKSINGYAGDKFESLIEYVDPKSNFKNEKNDEENMTYESIINDLQEVFVTKVKRISILYHRGDLTDDEYKKEKGELDENYYLNTNIKNIATEDINYLDQYVKP